MTRPSPWHTVAHAAGAALLVNAVPHTVHGLSGEPFPSPFADPPGVGDSTPAENVVWGGLNAVAGGALLLGVGRFRPGANLGTAVTVAAGLAAAFGISRYFAAVRGSVGSTRATEPTGSGWDAWFDRGLRVGPDFLARRPG